MIRVVYKGKIVPFSFQSHKLCANTWGRARRYAVGVCIWPRRELSSVAPYHVPADCLCYRDHESCAPSLLGRGGSQTPHVCCFLGPAFSPDLASTPFIPAKILLNTPTQRTWFLICLCYLRTGPYFNSISFVIKDLLQCSWLQSQQEPSNLVSVSRVGSGMMEGFWDLLRIFAVDLALSMELRILLTCVSFTYKFAVPHV